jgi:hypothetical protein
VFELLELITQRAKHPFLPQARVRITVLGSTRTGMRILDGGDLLATVETPEEVLDSVFTRVYRRASELASLKGWLRVHGAVAGVGGRRVVVIGPSGAGKTTLALGLLDVGAAVEVDESFVTCGPEVVGVARRFHVQPDTADVLGCCPWLDDSPRLGISPIRAVDPTEHGFAWSLPAGPVEHVVVLRRTDGASSVEEAPFGLVVQEIITQVFPLLEARSVIVRQASQLAKAARCHVLSSGPDRRAARLVMDLVRSCAVS